MRIDHVAVAVRSLDEALATFRDLWGLEPVRVERVEQDGITEAMLPLGDAFLQLIEASRDDSPVARFLERRGEGLHHIAVAVDDIDAALDALRERGAQLVDPQPRPGGGGHRVAFVHPKSTHGILIELVEQR